MNKAILLACTIPTCLSLGVGFIFYTTGEMHVNKIEEMLRKDKADESAFIPIQKLREQNFLKCTCTLPRW